MYIYIAVSNKFLASAKIKSSSKELCLLVGNNLSGCETIMKSGIVLVHWIEPNAWFRRTVYACSRIYFKEKLIK